jgi:N5-(cytidine 5'-diphosphoramidyl)-L-glutamine hydrolase
MKRIAITLRLIENSEYYELREALDVQWAKLFKELNFIPIFLPYEYSFKKILNEMKVDGIILTGGNDLNLINSNEISQKRDNFELSLIQYSLENRIPLMGFCRGMQIIAYYFGASLYPISAHINIDHRLSVNMNSKYVNYLKVLEKVNSYHRYGIKNVNLNEILVSAVAETDSSIEVIEHHKYPIMGCLFHPERGEFISSEIALIQAFFNPGEN